MQMLESTSDPAGLGFDPERIRVLRCRLAGDPPCDLRKVEKLQQRIDKIRSRAEKIRSRMDKLCEPHWARVGLLLDQIDAMHVDVGQLDSEWDTIAAENFYYWIYDEETWGEYRYADLPDYRKSVKTTEEYTTEPPKSRKKSLAAWRAFSLAFGRFPERMFVNKRGHFAEITDFRGKRLKFSFDDFRKKIEE